MTTTLTTPIKLATGTMSGDVFYGTIELNIGNKPLRVLVSNHLKENKKYQFRVAAKCKAGFVNIADWTCFPVEVISGYKKNSLVNIQVLNEYGHWMNVFTTKGGKWHSIDRGLLEVLTVADMRTSHPNMCDMELWRKLGATSWADKAFTQNTKQQI